MTYPTQYMELTHVFPLNHLNQKAILHMHAANMAAWYNTPNIVIFLIKNYLKYYKGDSTPSYTAT